MRTRPLLQLALLPAAATVVAYLPQLLTNSGEMSRVPGVLLLGWLAVLLLAAPAVAALLNRSLRLPMEPQRVVAVAATQLAVMIALVRFDVWLEVRSGYLLVDSGEEAMAYGIGGVASTVVGLVLGALVTAAAAVASRGRGAVRHV